MIRNEMMAAAKPIAMLAMATLWMMEEKLPSPGLRILFDIKYERFNLKS